MSELQDLLGKPVVVDTSTPYIYLGTLVTLGEWFLTLTDVDVHDCSESQRTKEVYVLEARKLGIRQNRMKVQIRQDKVVSVSLLEDVIPY
ncbi:MAG: hypothetical protein ACYTFG_16855 [Planctomycetota bacterium]|jgi:small nuclear ribonucleoprotein (snRNP)-like protein